MTKPGPVVLVGLPRSGSTLLTKIINESPDHFALNDLYYLQLIDSQDSWNGFKSVEQAREAKELVRNMVRHRSAVHSPKGIANSAEMTPDQLDTALAAIDAQWPGEGDTGITGDWGDIVEAVTMAGAAAVGKTRWGWNTPQDYHHVDRLVAKWPDVRVIFLLRDPRMTLRSYKYYPKRPAADRYHPIAQSMAWRNAANAWRKLSAKYPDNMFLLTYEDLVSDTRTQVERINAFLGSRIDEGLDLANLGSNSSYAARKEQPEERALSPMELWLSDRVLYSQRAALGFDEPRKGVSFSGLVPLLRTSFRFAKYYGGEALTNPETRKRINRLLRPR
ncbi:sulfotransferase family protein [Qipengyuania zhejiangensis]|uniref:sulfotransferase family protein n=1 Tax=Qipengyuania zhejiangensis TaxID=3077782 RepID=UPI002D784E9D|nr:sulfotransferase [Qipengyuania sp. Z2]